MSTKESPFTNRCFTLFFTTFINQYSLRFKFAYDEYSNYKKVHEGRNVKRFREMLGIKQDALAANLGDDWNQQKVSLLEQKETIDPALLQQISSALKIPAEAIQNFDEEQAVNIIANTVTTVNDNATGQLF